MHSVVLSVGGGGYWLLDGWFERAEVVGTLSRIKKANNVLCGWAITGPPLTPLVDCSPHSWIFFHEMDNRIHQ